MVKKKDETKTDPSIQYLLIQKMKVVLIMEDNVFTFRYVQLKVITGHQNRKL